MTTRTARRLARPGRIVAAAAGALALAASLVACEALPGPLGGEDPASPAATAAPMAPEQVAGAETVPVDPAWLCEPGTAEDPLPSRDGGTLTPTSVQAEGNEVMITGDLALEPGAAYGGLAPEAVIVPAHPADRAAPAEGYGDALGVDGAPAPPMVVRARVETTAEGPAPSTVTARLVLGTCDDAPLPDGQYLLRLSGAGPEGSGRAAERSGWEASSDVLLDVVDGRLRAVPGAVTAEDGETPADLSSLGCGRELAPVGDGAGLSVTAADPSPAVHAEAAEDEAAAGATAQVSAASEDHGTLPLMTGIVVTRPGDGVIVAGARNAGSIPLQWMDGEGVSTAETAWTTHGTCHGALSPGDYRAHAFAVTVDAEGATHVVLSDPWDLEVLEGAEPEDG
ncbi:hypothetical protein ACIGH6_12435 [Brachybacterium paraconglomeratum]|uniref:hypothetical protein n=1 Tax=Brachybacterium paraconglomeratum TaxID=173362 RepID=UPI0037CA3B29